jgi:hypothetical protein
MPWRSMERKESRYEEVDPSFSAASSVVPFVTAFDGAEIQMLKKIFRRDSGRSEVRPSGEMTIEDRGSAEMPSFPGRDSSAVSGTARSAAARSRLSVAWSLFLAPFAFARKLLGLEDDDFSFSIGRKRGHHPECEVCEDVHDVDEICPRAMVGDCSICIRTVDLDRYLNCKSDRRHVVTNRRAKATGRRLRLVGGAR